MIPTTSTSARHGPRHAADNPWWTIDPPRRPAGGSRHAAPDAATAAPDTAILNTAILSTALETGNTAAARTGTLDRRISDAHLRDRDYDREREVALFAAETRRAIAAKGLPLRQVEGGLDAYGPDFRSAIGTLSAWQSGATAPPNTESGINRVLALERCLDVPAGDLAILIPGDLAAPVTRPLTQIGVHNRPARATLSERHKQFQHIVNRLSGSQRTIPVRTTKKYVLGWEYRPVQTVINHHLRAAHDVVDRYWFLHAPTAEAHPTVVEISGCTVGRVIHEAQVLRPTSGPTAGDGGYRLVAVELLFDKVLNRGEPYEFSFSIGYSGTDTRQDDLFRHIQIQPLEALDLRLECQDHKPGQLQECRWTSGDLQLVGQLPLKPDPRGRYRQLIRNPIPAAYGWTWANTAAGSSTETGISTTKGDNTPA
jgi:hypothetical protein